MVQKGEVYGIGDCDRYDLYDFYRIYSPSVPLKKKWKKSNVKGNGTKNELKSYNTVCFADQSYKVGGRPIKWGT